MRRIKSISIKVHPEFFRIMECERKKLNLKGINISQANLTRLIAKQLNERRRGFGMLKKTKK